MGKIVVVSSGKGGIGKTTTVAAVSSCLATLGFKTLCIDFDAGMRNLDLSLCMTDFAVTDFTDVVDGRMTLSEAVHESPDIPNLFFLAAPALKSHEEIDKSALSLFFDTVREEFDYCIIDSPSGIGAGFKLGNSNADMSIIITTGELPSLRDSQHAAIVARDCGVRDIRLLVNRVQPRNFKYLQATVDGIIDTVGARLIGVVPEDKSVFRSLHENIPLILYNKRLAAYEFLDVARRISGEDVPLRRFSR